MLKIRNKNEPALIVAEKREFSGKFVPLELIVGTFFKVQHVSFVRHEFVYSQLLSEQTWFKLNAIPYTVHDPIIEMAERIMGKVTQTPMFLSKLVKDQDINSGVLRFPEDIQLTKMSPFACLLYSFLTPV